MKILVTGHAGFIGSNLVKRLFKEMQTGRIVGIDNLNDYYDPSLKEYRLAQLAEAVPAGIEYRSVRGDISDRATVEKLFAEYHFDVVVNLAAQAGVRYSIDNPDAYIQSNINRLTHLTVATEVLVAVSEGGEVLILEVHTHFKVFEWYGVVV